MISKYLDEIMIILINNGIYRGNVALKGGYLLNKLLNSRGTVDIDLSLSEEEDWKSLEEILIESGRNVVQRGLANNFSIKEPIAGKRSGQLVLFGEGKETLMKIDISIQKLDFGINHYNIEMYNGFNATLPAYSFERIMGDKISATFSTKQFRRVKDIYDIYCITNLCELSFKGVKQALTERNFKIDVNNSPFRIDAYDKWENAWRKFRLRNSQGGLIEKPNIYDMLVSYNSFIQGYLNIDNNWDGREYIWNNSMMRWE